MILLFGGTTEGLAAARLLKLLGFEYLYSTKTPTLQVVDGEHITGALDTPAMVELCLQRAVNLIIDASHPFAENLHQNICDAAKELNINTIRFNREEVDLSVFGSIHYFASFEAMRDELQSSHYQRVLALTGVQTSRHGDIVANSHEDWHRHGNGSSGTSSHYGRIVANAYQSNNSGNFTHQR